MTTMVAQMALLEHRSVYLIVLGVGDSCDPNMDANLESDQSVFLVIHTYPLSV